MPIETPAPFVEGKGFPPRVPLWDCVATVLGMAYDGPAAIRRLENRYGPLFVMGVGGRGFYHLSGPEVLDLLSRKDSGEILHEPMSYRRAFSNTLDGAAIANSLEGVDHSRARSVVNRGNHALSGAERIENIAALTHERMSDLADGSHGGATAIKIFGDIATRQVGEFYGIQLSDQNVKDIRVLSSAMVRAAVVPGGGVIARIPAVNHAKDRLRELGREVIAQIEDGSVSAPVLFEDAKRASTKYPDLFGDDDLVWHILTPLIGSAETLPGSMVAMFWHVCSDRTLVAELGEECDAAGQPPEGGRALFEYYSRPLLDGCVEEGLRIAPVTWMLRREAAQEFEYSGFMVPEGADVTLNSTRAHFSREEFADPFRFDPRRSELRTNAKLLSPFGTGTHICPGISLSKLLLKMTLVEAVKSFDFSFTESPFARARGRMSFTGAHSFSTISVRRR